MLAPHHRSMSQKHTRDQMCHLFSKLSWQGLGSLPSSSGLFSIYIQMYFVLNTQNYVTILDFRMPYYRNTLRYKGAEVWNQMVE